jgi:hypothetical protein
MTQEYPAIMAVTIGTRHYNHSPYPLLRCVCGEEYMAHEVHLHHDRPSKPCRRCSRTYVLEIVCHEVNPQEPELKRPRRALIIEE